ncbi:hypothetical protein BH09PAT4_BH09PAT4_00900 [soil metagenome]
MRTSRYPHTKQRRRHTRRAFGLASLLVLALVYVGGTTLFVPLAVVAANSNASTTTLAAEKVILDWPTTGQAAIGAEGYGLLASHNTEQVLPTASVIKTVMALCVLEKRPLATGEAGPTLTMSQQDVASYNWYLANHGSVMPVRVGQQLTERQALESAMLRSANNMADTLAIWAFGSISAYREYATSYISRIGLTQTTIGTDASGLNPSTVSTASDLVRLGLVAMKNPALVEIVGLKSTIIPEVGTITNTNNLLGQDGIVGIKTGTDIKNKGVYLFASRYQPQDGSSVLIVGAVMGAPTSGRSRTEALKLLASARKGFEPRTIYKAGQTVGTYEATWSEQVVPAVINKDIAVSGWRGAPIKTSIALKSVHSPATAGKHVGDVSIVRANKSQIVGSVTLAKDVDAPSLWWRISHPLQAIRPQ